MKTKYKIGLCVLILCFVGTFNLFLDNKNNDNQTNEVKEVKKVKKVKKVKELVEEEDLELEDLEDLEEESTNIPLVLNDFKDINDNAEIKANKDGNKLIVQITQSKNENGLKANFVNITQYTDWACKNIKNDIKILDISVLLPGSKIRVVLSMDKMVDNDYFDENYVKGCIVND